MTATSNVALLKTAYAGWADSKGTRPEVWLDIVSDDVILSSMDGSTPGLQFAGQRNGKARLMEYFSGLLLEWEMVHWTPQTYVSENDFVAMFGRTAWRNKSTGKIADVQAAHLWRFKDGKVVEMLEVFDTAVAVGAATAP